MLSLVILLIACFEGRPYPQAIDLVAGTLAWDIYPHHSIDGKIDFGFLGFMKNQSKMRRKSLKLDPLEWGLDGVRCEAVRLIPTYPEHIRTTALDFWNLCLQDTLVRGSTPMFPLWRPVVLCFADGAPRCGNTRTPVFLISPTFSYQQWTRHGPCSYYECCTNSGRQC